MCLRGRWRGRSRGRRGGLRRGRRGGLRGSSLRESSPRAELSAPGWLKTQAALGGASRALTLPRVTAPEEFAGWAAAPVELAPGVNRDSRPAGSLRVAQRRPVSPRTRSSLGRWQLRRLPDRSVPRARARARCRCARVALVRSGAAGEVAAAWAVFAAAEAPSSPGLNEVRWAPSVSLESVELRGAETNGASSGPGFCSLWRGDLTGGGVGDNGRSSKDGVGDAARAVSGSSWRSDGPSVGRTAPSERGESAAAATSSGDDRSGMRLVHVTAAAVGRSSGACGRGAVPEPVKAREVSGHPFRLSFRPGTRRRVRRAGVSLRRRDSRCSFQPGCSLLRWSGHRCGATRRRGPAARGCPSQRRLPTANLRSFVAEIPRSPKYLAASPNRARPEPPPVDVSWRILPPCRLRASVHIFSEADRSATAS